MPIPGLILALAQAAPSIIGLLDSDDASVANRAARAVSETARAVTGEATDEGALAVLKADPAKMIEYQSAMNAHAVSMYQSETERLKSVNETMRAETASSDEYVRRMRPTMGYALILSWTATVLVIVYTIVAAPQDAPAVIKAVAELGTIWTVALSVLGLYVYKRSEDKKPPKIGILSALASRVAR